MMNKKWKWTAGEKEIGKDKMKLRPIENSCRNFIDQVPMHISGILSSSDMSESSAKR